MMKKLVLNVFIFSSLHVFSQGFILKPAIGINSTIFTIAGNDKEAFERFRSKPGFDVGVAGEVKITSGISFEMSWMYNKTNGFTERIFHSLAGGSADYPYAREKFSLNSLKVPLHLVLRSKTDNKCFFGAGLLVRHFFESSRSGDIVDYPDSYSDRFYLMTYDGGKNGIGLSVFASKKIKLGNQRTFLKLLFDTDISKWEYPTIPEYEVYYKSPIKLYNFSLQFSIAASYPGRTSLIQ
jgi:hypothetical protein